MKKIPRVSVRGIFLCAQPVGTIWLAGCRFCRTAAVDWILMRHKKSGNLAAPLFLSVAKQLFIQPF